MPASPASSRSPRRTRAHLADWGVKLGQFDRDQEPFVKSLGPAHRAAVLKSRQGRLVPAGIEFVTVVCVTAEGGKATASSPAEPVAARPPGTAHPVVRHPHESSRGDAERRQREDPVYAGGRRRRTVLERSPVSARCARSWGCRRSELSEPASVPLLPLVRRSPRLYADVRTSIPWPWSPEYEFASSLHRIACRSSVIVRRGREPHDRPDARPRLTPRVSRWPNAKRMLQSVQFLRRRHSPPNMPRPCSSRPSMPRTHRQIQEIARSAGAVRGHHQSANPRVKVKRGPAAANLQQGGYTPFIIKVHNESTVTKPLKIASPQALPIYSAASRARSRMSDVKNRFLDVEMFTAPADDRQAQRPEGRIRHRPDPQPARRANARRPSSSTSARERRTSAFAAKCRCCSTSSRPSRSS